MNMLFNIYIISIPKWKTVFCMVQMFNYLFEDVNKESALIRVSSSNTCKADVVASLIKNLRRF